MNLLERSLKACIVAKFHLNFQQRSDSVKVRPWNRLLRWRRVLNSYRQLNQKPLALSLPDYGKPFHMWYSVGDVRYNAIVIQCWDSLNCHGSLQEHVRPTGNLHSQQPFPSEPAGISRVEDSFFHEEERIELKLLAPHIKLVTDHRNNPVEFMVHEGDPHSVQDWTFRKVLTLC